MAKACDRCGEPVRWLKRKGYHPKAPKAWVLLDAEPSPIGTHAVADDRIVPDDEAPQDAQRFTPHRATCAEQGRSRVAS